MKTKAITAIIVAVFLSSTLSTVSVRPAVAENPIIAKVERSASEYWFLLMTGYYPLGVTVGGVDYDDDLGFLGLTYQNLSPETQLIILETDPPFAVGFIGWPAIKAECIRPEEWGPYEQLGIYWDGMGDIWVLGWSAGEEIHVTLKIGLRCGHWPYVHGPEYWMVYEYYMTIPPPAP